MNTTMTLEQLPPKGVKREQAILALGKEEANGELLLQLVNTEKGKCKTAAQKALAQLEYAFDMESPTGGLRFRMLTENLRLNTGLLDTFLPLIKAHYLDFIDRFEVDPTGALQPVCAPFIQPEDYSWRIHVDEQMVERYGTPEQLAEYRRQAELRGTPEHKAKNWMGSMLFHLSHANDVDQAWASSRTKEELDKVVEPFVQAKRQTRQWTQEDEAGYQLYQQETDPRKRTFRVGTLNELRIPPFAVSCAKSFAISWPCSLLRILH